MKIESYRDLLVWQKSMDLVVCIYEKTKIFPKNEEYGLQYLCVNDYEMSQGLCNEISKMLISLTKKLMPNA